MNTVPKILLLFTFVATACGGCFISRTPGFNTGYRRLSEEDKAKVVFVNKDSAVCHLQSHKQVYAVTGKQLSACLKNNDTSVVYFWAPNCHSQSCILISACQQYCSLKNYKLYVVAEYYNMQKMQAQNVCDFPMLTANEEYYNMTYVDRLSRSFIRDLAGDEIFKYEDQGYRFLFFKGDNFIKGKSRLFDN